jgi:peptidoglycan/LPS O-acetylase OafA/YrhL
VAAPADAPRHYSTFDALRIIAAIAVILSHAYPLTGHREPFTVHLGGYTPDLGTSAVAVFFVISGFLITMSWNRTPGTRSFVVKRFARIWPGFAVVVLAAAFILGPLVTTLAVRDYLTSGQTWGYVGHNLFMAPIKFTLPGVFADLPNHAVNGSLWTLPYEVLAYVSVLVLGIIGCLRRRMVVLVVFVAVLLCFRLSVATHELDVSSLHAGGITGARLLVLLAWFFAGAILFLFSDRIPRTGRIAFAAALVLAAGLAVGESLLVIPSFAYLIIFAGTRPSVFVDTVRRRGDPSYGIYLYAFPIQQLFVLAGVRDPLLLFIIATPIAIIFGYLSWHLIENPSIRALKGFARSPKRAPL